MPSKNKSIGSRARPEFVDFLDSHLQQSGYPGSRSDYVLEAITEKLQHDGAIGIPVPKAPSGISEGERPTGWRSRLYKDRYQLVAALDDSHEWHICHQHESTHRGKPLGVIRAETPYPLEVTVYCADSFDRAQVQQALGLELMSIDYQFFTFDT
jgi:hypothetical protein